MAPVGLVMTSGVADVVSASDTSAGVASGLSARYSAAAPATCGAAIDVPDSAVSPPPICADTMSTPGA